MTSDGPIGIFDSGVGGLSVLCAVRSELPDADLIYVADSAHVPYADKPPAFIEQRSQEITGVLLDAGARAIVVACNTATGIAIDALRSRYSHIPIVGIEPAVKPAAAVTRSGVVAVLATGPTLASDRFSRLLALHATGVRVLTHSCPGFVEQVEKGELAGPATRALVARYLRPLLDQGADTIVLGCTHYPFLRDAIASAAGAGVEIIDPAVAVARELRRRLTASAGMRDGTVGGERFFTSGDTETAGPVFSRLLGRPIVVSRLTDLGIRN